MQDSSGRTIDYLRLSITDLCDLRCKYCMPADGVEKRPHSDILSVEELLVIAAEAAKLGVAKVRITGGEPLVRRGVLEICKGIAAIPGIKDLSMTTNGMRLAEMAHSLREAGVQRLNISLDTLRPARFTEITRGGDIRRVLDGIQAAEREGFSPLKMNVVLMGGVNVDEITDFVAFTEQRDVQVRFIELMPMGECAAWQQDRFVDAGEVLRQVPQLASVAAQGVAQVYQVPGYKGTVGLIRPMSQHFCARCNRLRVTADGRLKPCLHSNLEILLKGLSAGQVAERLLQAVRQKPAQHHMGPCKASETERPMNRIGG